MNALSYGAGWRWLAVQAGDVTARFSNYGLNGTTIRGGYLRAKPGNWQIELIGGKSRRAVRPSLVSAFREPSFDQWRSEEHTSELQSRGHIVCRLLLEK